MLNRRRFLMSTAAAGAAGFAASHLTPAFAQDAPQIQIFVPAAPGRRLGPDSAHDGSGAAQ